MAEHFIIYCDESTAEGRYYSHFYGGAMVRADDRAALEADIAAKKGAIGRPSLESWRQRATKRQICV